MSNTSDVVRTAVITFIVPFFAAVSTLAIFFIFEPLRLAIFLMVLRPFFFALRAIDRLIISFGTTLKAQTRCVILFSETGRSSSRSFSSLRSTCSASNGGSIFTTRVTAIFAQSRVNACLLCFLVSHIHFSITSMVFNNISDYGEYSIWLDLGAGRLVEAERKRPPPTRSIVA